MAKGRSRAQTVEQARELKRKNKLNSLHNEFVGDKIKSFDQVFAIFSETPLAAELNIPFKTFRKKVESPGEFTYNEAFRFAKLIDVPYSVIEKFILGLMKYKKE